MPEFWTLSRGDQVITCELVTSSGGQSIVRCGSGQHTVRSQFIASSAAAAAVSETWRAALLLQGFHVEASRPSTPSLKTAG
jgi:hypothetical protein